MKENLTTNNNSPITKTIWKFLVLLGIVSLFADMTYEGAKSITGPYLAILGASGASVGIVMGLGELIGYSLRLLSGYLSDKTKKYWSITIIGYIVNLLAVPLISLAHSVDIVMLLIITERLGKAIRTPARDVILSQATTKIGHGVGFGIHEAMDQIGAILGPLMVAGILYIKEDYRLSFGILGIPAILALAFLFKAKGIYPHVREMESRSIRLEKQGMHKVFWIYLGAISLIALGFVDFPLIAFYFKKISMVSDEWIPILYALLMGIDALAALLFGRFFDKKGFSVLIIAAVICFLFPPLIFWGKLNFALIGIVFWGIGLGAQESIMRAAVAKMVPLEKRGSAYGIFNLCYGISWFIGSAIMGFLYDISLNYLIIFSVIAQLSSIPLLILITKSQSD